MCVSTFDSLPSNTNEEDANISNRYDNLANYTAIPSTSPEPTPIGQPQPTQPVGPPWTDHHADALVVPHYLSSRSTRPSPIISLSSLPPPSPLSLLHSPSPSNLRRDPLPAGSHGFHLQRRRDRPLLRIPRRRRGPRLLLHGRGVRDGQERGGGGVDGGDAAGAGDEVHRARRHGGGARDLRPHHRRHHLHRDQPQGQALLPLRRLRAPLLRPRLRPRGARRRHGHRHRRRRRRQGQRTAAQAVRWNDPHPHLCRSPCPVRPHCRHHPLLACRPIPRRLET